MARKKVEGKKYNYMDTYGDLVTLLLCFFVLLFAMSSVDEVRYNAFVEALSQHFGPTPTALSSVETSMSSPISDYGSTPPQGEVLAPDQTLPEDFNQLAEAIEKFVEENNLEGEVEVQQGESGAVFIRLSNNLLFDGDSYVLRPDALFFLDFLGDAFLAVEDQIFNTNFIGHTGSIPGSGTDDWVLSARRSGGVASYFERTVGFSPYKIELTGYGRLYPIADNATPEGLAANRRVDIVAVSNNASTLSAALAEAAQIYFPDDNTEFFEGAPEELRENALAQIPPSGEGTADITGLTDEELRALYEEAQQAAE